jgi:hypothetical protein
MFDPSVRRPARAHSLLKIPGSQSADAGLRHSLLQAGFSLEERGSQAQKEEYQRNVADVKRFCYAIKTDEIFDTHRSA